MFSRGNRRSGFTLPEVLVTVAIVAVLAAMVVPAVTQQLGKGDTPATEGSINSLRTMITSFVSDVRKNPGDVEDLQVAITGADFELFEDGDGTGAPTYSAAVQARWRGPYEASGSTTGQIDIGYGWRTTGVLMDSLGYVVVVLTKSAGADSTDANELERALDVAAAGSNLTGMVRYENGALTALDPANQVRLFLMSSRR